MNNPTIKTDTLTFDQINDDKILIKQISKNAIAEISSEKSDKDYIVLTGYFNIYTTADGNFQNYIDGIIQYIFDNKTGQYLKKNIQQYRYIKFDISSFQNQDTPFINFTGIMNIPSLENLMITQNSNKSFQKNYNEMNNELLMEVSKVTYEEKDKNFLGYLFNNFKAVDTFKFSEKISIL